MRLALLGCAVQMHKSTKQCKTWDVHSLNGWYIGMSDEHYRCHKMYCHKTRLERISDTVFFQHGYLTQPVMTPANAVIKAMGDLQSVLKQHSNKGIAAEMEVLKQMDEYLNGKTCNTTLTPKQVTFESSAPIKTVATTPNNNEPSPRVPDTLPRVVTSAAIDKPYGVPQGITIRSRAKAQQ